MSRRLLTLILMLVVVLGLGGGYMAYQSNQASQQNLCQASTLAGSPRGS